MVLPQEATAVAHLVHWLPFATCVFVFFVALYLLTTRRD
jgi:hypothetical protein